MTFKVKDGILVAGSTFVDGLRNTTTNDLTVGGNLTVNGTTTTLNTATLDVVDLNITVAKNATTAALANGAGLTVNGAAATILYTSATDTWNFNKTIVATLTGNASGLSDTSSYMYSRGSVADASIDTAIANGFYLRSYTGASASTLTWNAGGSTGPVQFDVNYGNTGTIRLRNKTDSATWSAWRIFLTDQNVASYAVSSIAATTPIVTSAATGAITLSHAASGVTAGTYNTVTVNATGHVTTGSNTAYLTAESDTLATVTARGATTSTASIFSGGITGNLTGNFNNTSVYLSPTNLNTLNSGYSAASDSSDIWINYRGYADGFTYFRDFRVGDGKSNIVALFTGSSKSLNVVGAITQNGSQVLHAGNYTSYSPTLTGGSASGTWGISITGSAATATSSTTSSSTTYHTSPDGDRLASTKLPNSSSRLVRYDFVGAGQGNGTGNYAGLMTYNVWDGTTASTGDSAYQLAFANTSGVNASGQPKLSIRNGIDTTWNAWYVLLHSGNVSSYALTAESDTLATVTSRGATTGTASTFSGGLSGTTGSFSALLNGQDLGITGVVAAVTAGVASAGIQFYGNGIAHANIAWLPNEHTFNFRTGNGYRATTDTWGVCNVNMTGTVTASNFSGTSSGTNTGDQTVGAGTLTPSNGTGSTSTSVALTLSNAYSANSSTNTTLNLLTGPALVNLATFMTTAGAGFIKRGATADTYTIDTSAYITLASAITGYVVGTNTALVATDTLNAALGKIQGQITARSGTVTGVTATAPVVSSGGTAPVISMAAATTSVAGYLTAADWNTFNGKVGALTDTLATVTARGSTTTTTSSFTSGVAGTTVAAQGYGVRVVAGTTDTPAILQFTNNAVNAQWASLSATNGVLTANVGTFTASAAMNVTGTLTVSSNNTTGGGIILADDGDIVDLNDAYCSMRFSSGVRIYSANKGGTPTIALGNGGGIIANGNITAYGAASDITLKENIVKLGNALSVVKQLNGYYFNYIGKEDRLVGVIAQEVEKVLPELVYTFKPLNTDEDKKAVKYELLSAVLIEAIKEQQIIVDSQEARIARLEALVSKLIEG